ncbi:MAG: DUF4881 domain-containing protein [Desulfovibrio sp.]|jgi:hypothetical protein|nr:DUF4881 domain-containing protein [Desulfovibrio sp.]
MKKTKTLLLSLLVSTLALAACTSDSGVEQGRCVAFDPAAKTMTLVADTVRDDRSRTDYSGAVITYKLPAESKEMGPAPTVGGRLMVDVEKSNVLVFDPVSKKPREIAVEFTSVEKNIDKTNPKVAGKTFPLIDKEKQTITIYSARLSTLTSFKPPQAAMELPAEVWTPGDEMRVAFKQTDKTRATRVMNVSKTNIFRR